MARDTMARDIMARDIMAQGHNGAGTEWRRNRMAQNFFLLHGGQWVPLQMLSNCSMTSPTKTLSSVIMPDSKFLLCSLFAPMPAPVRLALPV